MVVSKALHKQIYYVYTIVDPKSNLIVYIGKGYGGRAWYMHRNGQTGLKDYLLGLCDEGYTPDEFVKLIARKLTHKDAHAMELELIHKHWPKYNMVGGKKVLDKEQVLGCMAMRKKGVSLAKIAKHYDTAVMNVYRACSGKSSGYVKLMKEYS